MNISVKELHGYEYKSDIWPHQEAELLRHHGKDRWGLFWAMRTGKTRPVLEYAGWLTYQGRIDLTIIICSKIAITENVWGRQAAEHLLDPPEVFSWVSSRMGTRKHQDAFHRWYRSKATGGRVLVINREAAMTKRGVSVIEQLTERHPKRLMVSDEHHALRNNSRTHKQLLKWFTGAPYVRVITGTPLGNRPSALYWQMRFVHKKPFGTASKQIFLSEHAHLHVFHLNNRQLQTEKGYRNRERTLKQVRKYGSIIRRDECPWLPDLQMEWMSVPMAPEADRQMKRLVEEGEYGAALRTRARQLCSGFLLEDRVAERPAWEMDGMCPKTAAVRELLTETDEKVIIYCAFRREAERLVGHLKSKCKCVLMLGGEPAGKTADTLRQFRTDPNIQVLVATAQCIQDSIDLSCAAMVIWHSLIEESTVFEQASARHAGSGRPVICVALTTQGTIEQTIAYALRNNLNLYTILQTHEYQDILNGTV